MFEGKVLEQQKGQVAVEFLVLAIILLGVIAILGGFAFILFSDSLAQNQIQDALRVLQTSVNHVHGLGPENAVVVSISLPGSIMDSNVGGLSGKELVFSISATSGTQTYWIETDANVFGTLPSTAGTFLIRVLADTNSVSLAQVSEG